MLLNYGAGEDLRVPWTVRRSNQSILKEINPEYSLGGLMLKLKLQYFGYLMERANSLEKMLMLGKIEGKRRRGQQRMGWLDYSKGQGSLACCSPWGRKESNMTLANEQQQNKIFFVERRKLHFT